VEKYEKQIKELSKDKRNYNQSVDTCNVFSVSSIYSKAFNKARMPEIESFSKAIKNYFQ
jgi:flagellar biosynthesis chaperone FliJ